MCSWCQAQTAKTTSVLQTLGHHAHPTITVGASGDAQLPRQSKLLGHRALRPPARASAASLVRRKLGGLVQGKKGRVWEPT